MIPLNDASAALYALLDFYSAAGVDAVLSETAIDRFAESASARAAAEARAGVQARAPQNAAAGGRMAERMAPQPGRVAPRVPAAPAAVPGPAAGQQAVLPGEEAVMAARAAAQSASSLAELEAALRGFNGCNLKHTAKSTVFADGNPAARVMFLGEVPGAEEDRTGRAFAGKSGQLLDRMLGAIGLDRTSAFMSHVIYWRPPGNRPPSDAEVAICRPFIERQIELAAPDVLVVLGAPAAKVLLGSDSAQAFTKLRSKWMDYPAGAKTLRLMPTFDPEGLLRQPLNKRLAWRDLLDIKAVLENAAPKA